MGRGLLGRALVMVGTFSMPIAQWGIFWLLGRADGAEAAGMFAIMLSMSTPVFALTNLGLRNSYITTRSGRSFRGYLGLRMVGNGVGVLVAAAIADGAGVSPWFIAVVLAQKVADGFSDLLYARLQRSRRLTIFGLLMTLNGVATLSLAVAFAMIGLGAEMILAATALGSVVALAVGAVLTWRAEGPSPRSAGTVGGGWRELLAIAKESWPIGAWEVLGSVVLNVPVWVVSISGTAAEVGRYAGAAYILTAAWLVGAALSASAVGEYRALLVDGGVAVLSRRVVRETTVVTVASLAVAGLIVAVGGGVLQGVYGADFHISYVELAMIGAAAALSPGAYMLNAGLLVLNRYRRQMLVLALAILGSTPLLLVAWATHLPAVLLAGATALVSSILRFVLSAVELHRGLDSRRRMDWGT